MLAVAVLAAAGCGSERSAPGDADEFRERLDAALHAEPEQVLHIEFLAPAADGGVEVDRETWVDWRSGAYRHEYHGTGDDAPLTLILDGRRYYPPDGESQDLNGAVGGIELEPLELLQTSLGLVRFMDERARVAEAELDGERVWRLEQAGVSALEGGQELFCVDVQFEIDAMTDLPLRFVTAECGQPFAASYRFDTAWIDPDELPDGFFDPAVAADVEAGRR